MWKIKLIAAVIGSVLIFGGLTYWRLNDIAHWKAEGRAELQAEIDKALEEQRLKEEAAAAEVNKARQKVTKKINDEERDIIHESKIFDDDYPSNRLISLRDGLLRGWDKDHK